MEYQPPEAFTLTTVCLSHSDSYHFPNLQESALSLDYAIQYIHKKAIICICNSYARDGATDWIIFLAKLS